MKLLRKIAVYRARWRIDLAARRAVRPDGSRIRPRSVSVALAPPGVRVAVWGVAGVWNDPESDLGRVFAAIHDVLPVGLTLDLRGKP